MPQNDPRQGSSGLASVSDFPFSLDRALMSGIWTWELLYSWNHQDWKYSGALCKKGDVSPSSLRLLTLSEAWTLGVMEHKSHWTSLWCQASGRRLVAIGPEGILKPNQSLQQVFFGAPRDRFSSKSSTCPARHGRVFLWMPSSWGGWKPLQTGQPLSLGMWGCAEMGYQPLWSQVTKAQISTFVIFYSFEFVKEFLLLDNHLSNLKSSDIFSPEIFESYVLS